MKSWIESEKETAVRIAPRAFSASIGCTKMQLPKSTPKYLKRVRLEREETKGMTERGIKCGLGADGQGVFCLDVNARLAVVQRFFHGGARSAFP